MSETVRDYVVSICDQCIALEGESCNNPGCRFCRRSMPEVGEYLDVLLIRPIVNGQRLDEDYAKSMRVSAVNPHGLLAEAEEALEDMVTFWRDNYEQEEINELFNPVGAHQFTVRLANLEAVLARIRAAKGEKP